MKAFLFLSLLSLIPALSFADADAFVGPEIRSYQSILNGLGDAFKYVSGNGKLISISKTDSRKFSVVFKDYDYNNDGSLNGKQFCLKFNGTLEGDHIKSMSPASRVTCK